MHATMGMYCQVISATNTMAMSIHLCHHIPWSTTAILTNHSKGTGKFPYLSLLAWSCIKKGKPYIPCTLRETIWSIAFGKHFACSHTVVSWPAAPAIDGIAEYNHQTWMHRRCSWRDYTIPLQLIKDKDFTHMSTLWQNWIDNSFHSSSNQVLNILSINDCKHILVTLRICPKLNKCWT